jgi:phage-related protein
MKKVEFHPKALTTLREFPENVRRELGQAIFELQKGNQLSMPLAKPMSSINKGVEELRVKDASGAFRVFYFARLVDRVLVFHAFQKKTQKTPKHEIELGHKRLKELLNEEN